MDSNRTLDYYNDNATAFTKDTKDVVFTELQDKFISKLPKGAKVLDFGCGTGRDTKYFLQKNFEVDAIDGSYELCKIASIYTGIKVKEMLFQDLNAINIYDGIWACSSILHLSYSELIDVLKKMVVALKQTGIIYTSFKYGDFEGERNGRYFIDMDELRLSEILTCLDGITLEESWITSDVRPSRGNEKWLNIILKK